MSRAVLFLVSLCAAAASVACGGDDGPSCIEVSTDCEPLYEPTFDNLYTQLLKPTCGADGSQCHAREGAQAGLVFADPDQAHELLLGSGRVVPGDPGCSLLVHRTETDMPPGSPLSEAERCVIRTWIANGAER